MDRKKIYLILAGTFLIILVALILRRPSTPSDTSARLFMKATTLMEKGLDQKAELQFKKILEKFPESEEAEESLFALARSYLKDGRLKDAKGAYKQIIAKFSNSQNIAEAQRKLSEINMQLLFSPAETENSIIYEVSPGDNLEKIAKKFSTTVELIKRSNNLESDLIKPGMKLKIWQGKFSLVVDKSENTLTLKSDEEIMKVYPVSTGEGDTTPSGTFNIANKLKNPVWFKSGKIVPPESPENILGSRWLGFSISGYGIHGTNNSETVGRHITGGCIRMHNRDVEELYDILPVGTEVTILE